MLKILHKKLTELTALEQSQLEEIMRFHYPHCDQKYIDDRIRNDYGFDIALAKDKEEILGASCYKHIEIENPFSKRPLPVIHFAQALKKPGFSKSVLMRLSVSYLIKKMGYSYVFKEFLGIMFTNSPRVYETFTSNFDDYYPNYKKPDEYKPEMLSCLNKFFQEHREINVHINDNACFEYKNKPDEDITDVWERFYKSKNPAINEYFVQKGIIYFENERVFKRYRNLTAIAYRYRHPLSYLKNLFKAKP